MTGPHRLPCETPEAHHAAAAEAPVNPFVLPVTILGSSLSFIDGSVVNVALPAIGRDLGASLATMQWVVNGYMLTLASLILIGGAARGFGGVFVVVAVHLAALLTSYIAILGERWVAVAREPGAQEARAAARGMARGAAHSSMLARFSGRAEDRTTGGRR